LLDTYKESQLLKIMQGIHATVINATY